MPNKESIDHLRFLEAEECEKGIIATDQQQREAHFMRAAFYAACMMRIMRETEAAIDALLAYVELEPDGKPVDRAAENVCAPVEMYHITL